MAQQWVGTWTAAPAPAEGVAFSNITLRMNARVSLGGKVIRVRLSNAHGTKPLAIGAAHVGLRAAGAAVNPDTNRPLTFGGERSAPIATGSLLISDPVELAVPPLGRRGDHRPSARRLARQLRHHRPLCTPDQLHFAAGQFRRPGGDAGRRSPTTGILSAASTCWPNLALAGSWPWAIR